MKRILIIIAFVMACFIMTANPIVTPDVKISELLFDDSGWTMELKFMGGLPAKMRFDSVVFSSSASSAKLNLASIADSNIQILVVKNTDFLSDVFINKEGDHLDLKGYFKGQPWCEDKLGFGSDPSAAVNAPTDGQSIVGLSEDGWDGGSIWVYSLCNKPSIGKENDSSGCCATLRGKVFGADNAPVAGRTYALDFLFTTGIDGSFETQIYTKINSYSFIRLRSGGSFVKIQTLFLNPKIWEQIQSDIHLANNDAIDAATDRKTNVDIISYFPNPLTAGNKLSYKTVLPARSLKMKIEVYDELGKMIITRDIDQPEGQISLPEKLKNGMYFLNLTSGEKVYASTKIAFLR